MVDVDALEVLLEHLQLAQSAVGEAPVGQHREHRGEEAQAGVVEQPAVVEGTVEVVGAGEAEGVLVDDLVLHLVGAAIPT